MEFMLPEDQALKIKVLKDTKMKELYNRMFMLEECIEFKDAMKKLETQAPQPPPELVKKKTQIKETQAVLAKKRKNSASVVHESVAEEDEEVSPEEESFDE